MACLVLVACSEAEPGSTSAAPLSLEPLGVIEPASRESETPSLELPVYLRSAGDGSYWTLDTGRKGAVELSRAGSATDFLGGEGRGPGEISLALGFDLSPDGTIWIADAGNGKIVGYRSGRLFREFLIEHQPVGVASPNDSTIWVGGDLRGSVMVQYDRNGRRLRTVGVPVGQAAQSFRFNQGTAGQGSGHCAVLWAYTYYSRIDCFGPGGETLWQARSPVDIAPAKHADPTRMSADDEFAYIDVAAAGRRVYALFVGHPPVAEEGLRTTELHVLDESDGSFMGTLRLPDPAKFIVVHDSTLASLDYAPEPIIRLYRLRDGP